MATPNDVDDQERFLAEASNTVREKAFYMKRAMDAEDLNEALAQASEMLRELRTSLLSPRNYYELYMKVFDELRHLESFFTELNKRGKAMVELYEMVQSCGNVLPRLYLLITVGSVYIKSREAPAKDILKDLVEMAKGVQHPLRGLFLRNYLSQVAKDKLPDAGSPYEGAGGTVHDAIDFILQNFAEMNRLWVRMQSGGPRADKKRRERERKELRLLVGTNLERLSRLEGVDVEMYREVVQPRVLEQVTNFKDAISQHYLMECIIQVFPDEYHVATLEPFLATCAQLKAAVDVKAILVALLERLASFGSVPEELRAFSIMNDSVAKVIQETAGMEAADVLCLQSALLTFAIKCYPTRRDYVNHVLGFCSQLLGQIVTGSLDDASVRYVEELLTTPLTTMGLEVLALSQYPELMAFLSWRARKGVSARLLQVVLDSRTALDSVEKVEKLFAFLRPLLKDDEDTPGPGEEEDEDAKEEFEAEQTMVARLVHLMRHSDTDVLFQIYTAARKHFGQGGMQRICFTLTPLVFGALQLVHAVRAMEQRGEEVRVSCRKVLQFVHQIVTAMAPSYPALSLKIFLSCAVAADRCEFEAIAYEFVSQAFIIYEDELTDSKAQLRALTLMVGSLLQCRRFDEASYDTLITKTTQYAAKLLKKPDQCRMVSLSSHLFWVGNVEDERHYHNDGRVLECLQRALKIADVCMASATHVNLFVEILNHYLYYFEHGNPAITVNYLSGLIALIKEHMENMEDASERQSVNAHFTNTLRHIQLKRRDSDAAVRQRFEAIEGVPATTR